MLAFVILAALLAAFAVALVVVPLLRRAGAATSPAPWAAGLAALFVLAGGAAFYSYSSGWSWEQAGESADGTTIASLVKRVQRTPDDLDGWLELGRGYLAIEQFSLGLRAFERADRIAEGANAEALIGMAEALMQIDPNALTGRAGEYLDRAIELQPRDGKALFFGALASLERGKLPEARSRLATLLELEPPASVRAVLEQQIVAIDRDLGRATDAGATGDAQPAAAASKVAVRVQLAPALEASMPAGAPLFVFVRDAAGGPPLAVRKLDARFPQLVELDADDVMIAGRGLEAGMTVEVTARLAAGGTPTAQAGDPYGELRYDVGRDGVRDLIIDRLTP